MTDFLIDKQTISDLQLISSANTDQSIFSLFGYTATIGGKARLRTLFETPSSDRADLERKSNNIRFFAQNSAKLSLNRESLDFIEFYLRSLAKPKRFSIFITCKKRLKNFFNPKQDYYTTKRGVLDLYDTIKRANEFCNLTISHGNNEVIAKLRSLTNLILAELKLAQKKSFFQVIFERVIFIDLADFMIKNTHLEQIKQILQIIYEIDAYQAIAKAVAILKLSFPIYSAAGNHCIKMEGLFHPLVSNPVVNDFYLDIDQNVCFLTGANMTGKSTLIKSVGIAFYLAHIGFPVPARKMKIHVFDGLLTSINLSDNISLRHSHFYSEVLRVKFVLESLANKRKLLVIFDELFRGTNVRDATESSVFIMERLTNVSDSLFIISTHLVEAANQLKENPFINFMYLKSSVSSMGLSLSYKLMDGITDERLGLWILKSEGIYSVLNSFKNGRRAKG